MKNNNVICILAKDPKHSDIQTYLQAYMGSKLAGCIARASLLDRIASCLRLPRCDVYLAYWPPESEEVFKDLLFLFQNEEKEKRIIEKSKELKLMPQSGATPGDRLAGLSQFFFDQGARRLLAIYSESPLIEPMILKIGLELLSANQVVVGPTFSGNYYLIGADSHYPFLFDQINWNAKDIYKQTTEILDSHQLKWQELELSYDISGLEELQQLCSDIDNFRLAGKDNICYHTEKCLVNLKL